MFILCFPSWSHSKAFDSSKMLLDCAEFKYGEFALFVHQGVLSPTINYILVALGQGFLLGFGSTI